MRPTVSSRFSSRTSQPRARQFSNKHQFPYEAFYSSDAGKNMMPPSNKVLSESTQLRGRWNQMVLGILCALVLASTAARAQTSADLEVGLKPYGSYEAGDIDTVNLSNGEVDFRIPLLSYPQKGELSLAFFIRGTNKNWAVNVTPYSYTTSSGVPPTYATVPMCDYQEDNGDGTTSTVSAPCPNTDDDDGDTDGYGNDDEGNGGTENGSQTVTGVQKNWVWVGTGVTIGTSNDWSFRAESTFPANAGTNNPSYSAYVTDPTGGTHNMLYPAALNSASTIVGEAADGTDIRVRSGGFTDSHGVVTSGPWSGSYTVTDPDANQIVRSVTVGNTSTVDNGWTDSVGRIIPGGQIISYIPQYTFVVGTAPNPMISWWIPGTAASLSLCPSGSSAAFAWAPPLPEGQSGQYVFCESPINLSTNFAQPYYQYVGATLATVKEYSGTTQLLTAIILPNNQQWLFGYDSYGDVNQVTLPTGGTITYQWSTIVGVFNRNRFVTSRIINANDGTGPKQWTYSYGTAMTTPVAGGVAIPMATGVTTVTDPDNNQTVHAFGQRTSAGSSYETLEQVYEGSQSSGTLLKYVTTQYAVYGWDEQFLSAVLPTSVSTSLRTSSGSFQTTTVTKQYDSGQISQQVSYPFSRIQTPTFDFAYGDLTSTTTYDFGTAVPSNGAILQSTVKVPLWQQNSAYYSANIFGLPASTQILDGSNNQAALTSYKYDEASYSSGGVRGHPTTATQWLNTGSSIVSHTGWNANGEKSYVIDPKGNANTYGHTSDYFHNQCNGSVQTDTYDALNHHTSGTYDCNSGLLMSITDPNTNTTTYHHDVMGRILTATFPVTPAGTPETTFTYNDQSLLVTRTVTGGDQTMVTFDGLGRQKSQVDVGANTEVDTTYDNEGRVYSVTDPYTLGGSHVDKMFEYDGASRKILQTNEDNTTESWAYSGATTSFTDELSNTWQRTSDGLGRLTQVVEPGSLRTNYGYNALGSLISVSQLGVSPETPRTRSFGYDSLSRLLWSSNPETGTICYGQISGGAAPTSANCPANGYDPDSNLLYKTDARGVLTTMGYDKLNRVTSKTYTGSVTPSVSFAYDTSSISGAANTVGRLTSETVSNGTTIISERYPYAYDPLGRLNQLEECTPANCAASPYHLAYTYDIAGNLTASTNGIPDAAFTGNPSSLTSNYGNASSTFNGVTDPSVLLALSYDSASRLTGLSSSFTTDSKHPPVLFQAPSMVTTGPAYGPGGLQSAMFGVSSQTNLPVLSETRTYDNRLRVLTETDTGITGLLSAATDSVGSITIAGTEQQTSSPGLPGSTSITITGQEGYRQFCTPVETEKNLPCNEIPDTGSLSITVDGFTASISYSSPSTDASLASALAAEFGSTSAPVSGSPVTAVASGSVLTLTSIATGTASNYPFTYSNGADFSATDPNTALTGGGPAYDAGTISVTVNGTTTPVSYNSSSTPQSIATALAAALQTAYSGVLTASASGAKVTLTSVQTGTALNGPISATVTWNSSRFSAASFSTTTVAMAGGAVASYGQVPMYSYSIPQSGGYTANGNIASYTDNVNGPWSMTYDDLNRLKTATASTTTGPFKSLVLTMGYDSFGNRTAQTPTGSPPNTVNPVSITYDGNNDILCSSTLTCSGGVPVTPLYDAAGEMIFDGTNQVAYDAEGRVCAIWNKTTGGSVTQYLYDAEGQRIAKGHSAANPSVLACSAGGTDFVVTASYVLGAGGEQLTEFDGSGNWKHSNVYAGSTLLATYDSAGTHFHFADWLGTRRVQVSATGSVDETCASLPFGDGLNCPVTGADATEHHYTGKEQDTESGLDYFGARYYASSMGRWMSPDWSAKEEPIPYAKLDDPQSLNLYNYVGNNPLSRADSDGHIYPGPQCSVLGSAGCLQVAGTELKVVAVSGGVVATAGFGAELAALGRAAWTGLTSLCIAHCGTGASHLQDLANSQVSPAAPSVWSMGWAARGAAIEAQLGGNLPAAFPTIDRFIGGEATSIKSLDLNATSYQSAGKLLSTVEGYIDKVADFNGASYAGRTIQAGEITGRELQLAVPGAGNAAQQAALKSASSYAAQQNVKLTITQVH